MIKLNRKFNLERMNKLILIKNHLDKHHELLILDIIYIIDY